MEAEKAIEIFVDELRKQGRSNNTIKNYICDVKQYVKYTTPPTGGGGLIYARHTVETYVQIFEKSDVKRTTINRKLSSLRLFFDTMTKYGIIDSNPLSETKRKSIAKQNDTRWLQRHQVRQLFEAIDNKKQSEAKRAKERAIFSVLVNCGLRIAEVCDLRMQDVDWTGGFFNVIGKGDKFRRVPFNSATQRSLVAWIRYRRPEGDYVFQSERSDHMTTRAIQHMVTRIQSEVDYKFTAHDLRHTALKRIADETGKIEIVASVAGHENVNTSRRYIEPSMQEIGEAMKRTEFDF